MTSKDGTIKEGRWEKGQNVEWFAAGGMNPTNTMGANNLNPTNTMGAPVHNPANYLPNYNQNGTAPTNTMPYNMANSQPINNSSLSGFNPTGTNTMGGMNPTSNMAGVNQSMLTNNNMMATNMAANKMAADNYNNTYAGKIGSNVIGGTGSR